ncbi:uncharacterized protein TNCV_1745931 [Trichonephila clavipes]|nr:uncharacterized protein TNCV_1745931 [Trichonephila clavipes]
MRTRGLQNAVPRPCEQKVAFSKQKRMDSMDIESKQYHSDNFIDRSVIFSLSNKRVLLLTVCMFPEVISGCNSEIIFSGTVSEQITVYPNNYAKNKKKIGRRKYSSNQHKKSKSTEELLLNSVESASRRKIKIPDLLQEQDSQNVNIIVELDLLSSLMKNLLCCKYCCSSEKIELREDLKSRRGLAVSLEIICHNCGESTSTMSSKISNKCYDVNLRSTYGMRAIGKGGAAARIFCGLMNLPPPPAKFERHNSLFLNVLETISEDSMNAAVHEVVIANDNNSNIAVAVDGTWHKRGYSSLNGVVCATSLC